MADFTRRKIVTTRKPRISVEPGLGPGSYLMEVVPVTAEGKQLAPAYMRIEMTEREIRFKQVDLNSLNEADIERRLNELRVESGGSLSAVATSLADRISELRTRR